MGLIDRLLTIVVTATLTSAAWIVAGSSILAPGKTVEADQSSAPPTVTRSPSSAPGTPRVAPAEVPDAEEPGRLVIPVAGVSASQLSDTFTDARGGGSRLHEALDIMAPTGTPVVAAAAGKVEKLFKSDAGGNTIYIRSPDRLTIHYYAHLDRYASGLSEGEEVRRGEQLGTVGATGNANPAAPHLHFAILGTTRDAQWWEPATALNPYPLLVPAN